MKSPIDRLKPKYESADQHLNAITNAIVDQFGIPEDQQGQVRKAVNEAFAVGHRTTTTDDWCDYF
jgi:hypothetical protein